MALAHTIARDPAYLQRLERPARDLPPEQRPWRIGRLIGQAAKDMPGIAHVYYTLSEQMAHFGATAIFQAFSVDDAEERMLSYGAPPHWKRPDEDPRTALAMLLENDDAMIYLLGEWDRQLIAPAMEHYGANPDAAESLID